MDYAGSGLTVLLFKLHLIVFASGIIALSFFPKKLKPVIAILSVLLIAIATSFIAVATFSKGGSELLINGGLFFGEIPLRIDSLSAWFILIINFTSLTGVLYGAGYLKSSSSPASAFSFHWMLYIVFQSSMILVTVIQHSIAFLIAWEIMSLSSFLLILFDYTNPKVIKAGVNYLVQMHTSILMLTIAFIWVWVKTGSFDFKATGVFFRSNVNIWLFLVFFAGFGIKAGFVGLHTWLPQAHPAAPSHISGVMSGVIVKMGIYGILRIITYLKADYIILGEIILTLSVLTGVFGIMNSAVHRDFKKMLAYCTIENIGIIGAGIGVGLIGIGKGQGTLAFLGFGGALLHVLNHSLFKSLLFFSAGSVYRQTHTRDMDKLGGLIRKMPKTAFLFLMGAVAIGGIPPLNGFISEFLIYCGLLNGINSAGISQITLMILSFAGLSVIGGISILAFSKTFGTIFLGVPRLKLKNEPEEVSPLMLFPQYIITAFMIGIAIFPGFFISIAGAVLKGTVFPSVIFNLNELQGYVLVLKKITFISSLFLLLAGSVFLVRWIVTRRRKGVYVSTWGCGYQAPAVKMQYTGKSFSKPLGKLLNFIIIEKKAYSEIPREEIFPATRKYRSFYLDFFETKIIDPIIILIRKFINMFQFVQNGRIQAYVIYGIVFILAIFIATILNFLN